MEQSYTTTFTVDQTPETVFAAVNRPRDWWSQAIEGDTDKAGAVFYYHAQDIHRTTIKITEHVPNQRVVWHVLDNYFNFVQDETEWIGTDVVFEITSMGDQTELRFTHVGLVPSYECHDICIAAWGTYINGSLYKLITKGSGEPNPIEHLVQQVREINANMAPRHST